MTEAEILRAVQLRIGARPDCRVFRNSVGVARDQSGQVIRFGLAPGSSDLIGWVTRKACGCARFFAPEIKSETGRQTPEQKLFERAVLSAGGIYLLVRSADDAERAVIEAATT
jgi:hypothetical protein